MAICNPIHNANTTLSLRNIDQCTPFYLWKLTQLWLWIPIKSKPHADFISTDPTRFGLKVRIFVTIQVPIKKPMISTVFKGYISLFTINFNEISQKNLWNNNYFGSFLNSYEYSFSDLSVGLTSSQFKESIKHFTIKNSFNLSSFFCSSSQFPFNDCLIPIYAILHLTLMIIPRIPPQGINPIIKYLLYMSVSLSPLPHRWYDSIHSWMYHTLGFLILP